uniref:Egg protein CP422 n=1 Tax=Panagrellus redivivus TaxID=6233 RepID=A0A7E4USA4_PANRE
MASAVVFFVLIVFCHLTFLPADATRFTLFDEKYYGGKSQDFHAAYYECQNLPRQVWNTARSIKTYGRCIELFTSVNCGDDRFVFKRDCIGSACCQNKNDFSSCKVNETDIVGKFQHYVTLDKAAKSYMSCSKPIRITIIH